MKSVVALMFGAILLAPSPSSAQTYPDRPVRIIVPNGPGGGTDIIARMVAQKMSERWGKPVVVENKAGANANLGAAFVAKAKPDGYTILVGSGAYALNPFLYNEIGFELKEITPVTLLASAPFGLSVNPKMVPSTTVAEFIAFAKSKNGALNWASTSKGAPEHLLGEHLQALAGFKMRHISYKGGADALIDVLGDRVELGIFSLPTSLNYVKTGQLRVLGVSSAKRSPLMPDVPTIAETVPDFELSTWYAVWVTAGTPPDVIQAINTAFVDGLKKEDVQEKLKGMGFVTAGNTVAEFAAFEKKEAEKFAKIVASVGLEKQ